MDLHAVLCPLPTSAGPSAPAPPATALQAPHAPRRCGVALSPPSPLSPCGCRSSLVSCGWPYSVCSCSVCCCSVVWRAARPTHATVPHNNTVRKTHWSYSQCGFNGDCGAGGWGGREWGLGWRVGCSAGPREPNTTLRRPYYSICRNAIETLWRESRYRHGGLWRSAGHHQGETLRSMGSVLPMIVSPWGNTRGRE